MQPPSGGCELKQDYDLVGPDGYGQPPSGGCELKHAVDVSVFLTAPAQPPSGGCELKLTQRRNCLYRNMQPPSGGCELKLADFIGGTDCL